MRKFRSTVAVREAGDAYARAQVRMEEVDASIALIERVARCLAGRPGSHATVRSCQTAKGLGWAESPRGTLFYAVHIGRDGTAVARQDQIAVVLELAGVSVHRARQQHDGLRDQRGELRPNDRRLRSVGASHAAVDLVGIAGRASRRRPGRWPRRTRRPGRASWACRATGPSCAPTRAKPAPTSARPRRSRCERRPKQAACSTSITAAASSASSAPRPARPER